MKTVAVVPAYNEQVTIQKVIKDLKNEVKEIIVVDDGSLDATGWLAKQSGVIVLTHLFNRGQGAALKTGIIYALKSGADIIVTFDADGQHQAKDLAKVIQPLLLGEVDIVLGSRFLGNQSTKIPLLKFLMLKLAVIFTQLTIGLGITDTHNGFRAFSRTAAKLIEIKQDQMAHASEIFSEIKKHHLKFKEVQVGVLYTPYSQKKGQGIFDSFKIIWDLILGKIGK